MKLEIMMHLLAGFIGICFLSYGLRVMIGHAPVFPLLPPETEEQLKKDQRYFALSYGGLGLVAVSDFIWYFTGWKWADSLMQASTIVVTIYLLITLSFRVYQKGWYPDDWRE